MIRTPCALLLLSSATALACWDSERVEWHSVSIHLDHGHDTPSWSVSRAKEWAAYAAALGGPISLATGEACGEPDCLDRLPDVTPRDVPIWTVQIFASRTGSFSPSLVPIRPQKTRRAPSPCCERAGSAPGLSANSSWYASLSKELNASSSLNVPA